jgi:glycerol-3-phosphate acyltransferase PlsX
LASQRARIDIVEAPEVVGMDEKPSAAIRGKQNSSMVVGLKMVAGEKSDAFVSAGNTGAQMAASVVVLRLHAGLKRPAIATIFPTAKNPVVVLDSGANVDCGPEELVQFAVLGSIYAEDVLGRKKTRRRLDEHRRRGGEGQHRGEGSASAAAQVRIELHRQRRRP